MDKYILYEAIKRILNNVSVSSCDYETALKYVAEVLGI